ncbi:helix-turn-helix domain-containing protein [Pseudomonas baetica]|uniref:helix-turn-helix domain-containing protein n=1 Tax=Pseudomonas baetica TaxID=674054 RepID=UPI0021AB18C8|nr:helix-turn-helix domain-containing protein [Pseudomonas baetica]
MRLQQANQLLQSGQRQMPDVARDCGFVSVQHFIRCYRHYFGVHPRDHVGVNLLAIGGQPLAPFSLNRE